MHETTAQEAFSRLKPETIVFVISVDRKGRPNGMACGWHMKCSDDPALFAVALWNKGNTQKLIRQSKEFVVAAANKKLLKHLMFFGTHHGGKVDKFKESRIKTAKAKKVRSPLLLDATINMECRLHKEVKAGECNIFIGKVVAAHCRKGKILCNMKKKRKKNWVFKEF